MAKASSARIGSARKGGLKPLSGRSGPGAKVGTRPAHAKAAPVGRLDDKTGLRTRGPKTRGSRGPEAKGYGVGR
jgi:hypothetical protein